MEDRSYPGQVAEFSEALAGVLEIDPEALREFSVAGRSLVDLSVTLQRMPGYRERGLDIFERLLELGLYGARQVLQDVDFAEAAYVS